LLRRRQRPRLIEMRAFTPYDATSTAFKMLDSDQFSGTQSLILEIQTKDHTEGETALIEVNKREYGGWQS
jgi:hypothetical protein